MKGVSEISGLRSTKSMHSTGKRSIPRVQSSAYLDLYMLRKEKDRLEKEVYILDKRKKDIQKRINEVNKEMDKLEKAEAERKKKVSQEVKKPSEKGWKTMPLRY
jgi:predicted  nucleic acid-binding Zn-ribbon protein